MKFIGIDPSFAGMGVSVIDEDQKIVKFFEYKTDLEDGAFGQIAPIAKEFSKMVIKEIKKELSDKVVILRNGDSTSNRVLCSKTMGIRHNVI